jgi:hypothetical protein
MVEGGARRDDWRKETMMEEAQPRMDATKRTDHLRSACGGDGTTYVVDDGHGTAMNSTRTGFKMRQIGGGRTIVPTLGIVQP